jgi:hypothetical protein
VKNVLKVFAVVLLFVPMVALSQNWLVTIDEFGNGSYTTNGVTTTFTGVLEPDPSGGLSGNVLVYTLPFSFAIAGDFYMTNSAEPLPLSTASDVVRFWGPNHVIFYSDTNGVDALADTGLPHFLMSTNIGLPEIGAEGDYQYAIRQAQYAGGIWDPGWVGPLGGGGPTVTYEFISDVPEPSVLALAGTGLAGFAWLIRRRRNR